MKSARTFLRLLCVAGACWQAIPTSAATATQPEPLIAPIPTEITSAGPAEMISTATETVFTFQDQVVVVGTNLRLTCDRLVVVAKRSGDPKATLGKQENFKSLIATGHVRLVQNDREAICDRAEVLPGEDKVILTGNPATVRSKDGRYAGSGPEMILERGQQRAVIKSPRFVLPPLRDLGPGKDKSKVPAPAAPDLKSPSPNPSSGPASGSISVPITVPIAPKPASPQ